MSETSRFWDGLVTGDATEAPYDANTEFANYIRQTVGVGNTRANSGVVIGTGSESTQLEGLQVTPNSPAGMSVLLNIGTAINHGTTYLNDSALTLSIAANGSGNARIDTIVLRKSWVGQTVRAAVLQGTPAVTPVAPTLTQVDGTTWEIPIADVNVANGAVSITAANILQRAAFANAADGVYLDRILNNTGVIKLTGDPVAFDPTTTRAVRLPATAQDPRMAGVWQGRTAAGGYGRVLNRGIGYVRTLAAVTVGQWGYQSISGNNAYTATDERLIGSTCIFLETTTGAGPALAFVDFGIRDSFGALLPTQRLAAPAASITLGGWNNVGANTLVIEFYLRSTAVATADVINIRPNVDATAANYYSYAAFIGNSTPATTAVQNLAATAGIQIACPANNAPANSFAFGTLTINNVTSTTDTKHFSGSFYTQSSNINGGLQIVNFGGRWNDGASALTSLALVSNTGANFATGSYVNIYAKQTF